MTEDEVKALFGAHGTVDAVRIVMDRDSGRPKGFAFVEMNNTDEANAAIEAINGTQAGGRALVVNEARPREDRPRTGGFGGGNRRGGFGGGNNRRGGFGGGNRRGGFGGGERQFDR